MATTNVSATELMLHLVSCGINTTNNSFSSVGQRQVYLPHSLGKLETIISPIVCLVGTVLNLLTVGTFLSRPLKRISCCLYLATRSIAVFGFLVSLLIALTPMMHLDGVCEVTVFLSYFCPFISVWMVVLISIENFIRISHPSRVSKLCTPRVAKIVILVFVIFGMTVYNFPVWTTRATNGQCQPLVEFFQVVVVFNYIDAALTLFCPFGVMLIVVPLVALSAIAAFERKKRLRNRTDLTGNRPQSADSKSSPETRVTRLLFAVSVVFLLLHTPFHGIRMKVFLTGTAVTSSDAIIMFIFRLIYNLDTCVSCAVYLVFGDNFRKVFCNKYFSSCQSVPPETSQSGTTTCTMLTEFNVLKHDSINQDDSKVCERLLANRDV